MSPRKRRGTYRPPRPRREVVTAVVAGAAVILFTGIMVFVLGPHTTSPSTPITTTTVPGSSGATTPSSAVTSAPATSTPATTGSTSTTTPGG